MTRTKRSLLALLAALALPAAVPAATFTVDSTADAVDANPGNGACATAAGACTLRAAIQEANALAGADTVNLPAGTYRLSLVGVGEDLAATGDLDVTQALEVVGAGRDETVIDGLSNDGIFHVQATVPFTVRGVTLRNGFGATGAGGAILHLGDAALVIESARIERNLAANAGGVLHSSGALTVRDTVFVANVAAGTGGALYHPDGPTTIADCEFRDNSASGPGGAVYLTGAGNATITNTTFTRHKSALGGSLYANLVGGLSVAGSRFTSCTAGGGAGGCVYAVLTGGGFTFADTVVEDASATAGGGVLAVTDQDGSITNCRFTGNASNGGGGAIYSQAAGTFGITGSRFERNDGGAGPGGAIYHAGNGGVTLTDVAFVDNGAAVGGAILVATDQALAITRGTFRDNVAAPGPGGGIYVTAAGALTLAESAIEGNVSTLTPGGGAYVVSVAGAVTVERSTFANNAALTSNGIAGALFAAGTGLTVGNSTFSGNTAGGQGGALYAAVPTTIASSTFVGNGAAVEGSSIFNGAAVSIRGSVLGRPAFGAGCAGVALTSDGDNVDQDGGCALAGIRDRADLDPQLGPLQDNGGPTPTHEPAPTSPLVDTNGGICPPTDQRGVARPTDGNDDGTVGCDVGAVEFVDECLQDPAKTLPGVCGCGVPDVDANGNGPLDCLHNAELKVRIGAQKANVAAITGRKGADQKALKTTVKAGAEDIVAYVGANGAELVRTDPAADLAALAEAARKAAGKTLKGKGKPLRKKQAKAAIALDALDAAVAPQ
ncbi:MAG: right-handed parallel beta-helix repeat-containing protein [bacterium]|nr:right-handed parallel beta-helix repeat-containing protein [bacterium]